MIKYERMLKACRLPSYSQFKFCPYCGTEFNFDPSIENSNSFTQACTNCHNTFFENQALCVGVVLIKDGKFLMSQRAFEPNAGSWDFPGGFVDAYEHPEEACHREIKEELNVEIENLQLLGVYGPSQYLFQNHALQGCDVFYTATIRNGTISPQDDVAAVAWHTFDNCPPYGKISTQNPHHALLELKKRRKEFGL